MALPPRKPGRRPTRAEMLLWRAVTRNDIPLSSNLRAEEDNDFALMEPEAPGKQAVPVPERIDPEPAVRPKVSLPAPLACGDFKQVDASTAQRVRRGNYPIDRTLDLHGLNREQAFDALHSALDTAYGQGRRCVLVITGKGSFARAGKPSGESVLRENLPRWLAHPPLRDYILAYTQAVQRHGGEGAFYVLIKRRRGGA